MGRRSIELLFVLAICFVCLPLPSADTNCRKVPACSEDEDKEIMKCCLKSYKLGFDNLKAAIAGQDPPSCRLDLGLAKCLSHTQCVAKVTNALRILIFNQLVFTEKVGICNHNQFHHLLKEARNGFNWSDAKKLSKVEEMENMNDNNLSCATHVYAICGRRFKEELQKNPGFIPRQLCTVFLQEGHCNTEVAENLTCSSQVLTRFKHNSNKAAGVVLPVLCA